jgi:hypothetical protein
LGNHRKKFKSLQSGLTHTFLHDVLIHQNFKNALGGRSFLLMTVGAMIYLILFNFWLCNSYTAYYLRLWLDWNMMSWNCFSKEKVRQLFFSWKNGIWS